MSCCAGWKRLLVLLVCWCWSAALVFAAEPAKPLPPAAKRAVTFAEDIQPLFLRHCAACHGVDKQESNYRLDQKQVALAGGEFGEAAIIAGKSAESPLVRYIAGADETIRMPPKGPRLSDEEVGLIRAWIDQGAVWPEQEAALTLTTKHWSFQPLQKVAVPEVGTPHPIDAFIVDKLAAAKLKLSPAAARGTLIRRLYLDMLGLPPTPEEVQAFANDQRDNAYELLVERVLASPRYGERWARHWLDVVRFAETNGFETNVERPNAWRYRDYVIEALNTDKPYDQFVFEQLAGDSTGVDAATGFLVGGPYDQVKSPDPVLTAMQRSDELADMTSVTATAFLGLTVGCARCHNHKFDPILQKDYYALQAVFAGVQHGDRAMAQPMSPESQREIDSLQESLAKANDQLASLQPSGGRGRALFLDDETALADGQMTAGVRVLKVKEGHGVNPDGVERGKKNDAGDLDRAPNIGRGRYLWWKNEPGVDMAAYYPRLSGRQRVWLSWGCGWETHTTDAQYVLDLDGDLQTKDDQRVVATIDQQQFANSKFDKLPSQPLWSGFSAIGAFELKRESAIVVRGGKTGTAITADVIALEPAGTEQGDANSIPSQPPIRLAANPRENIERFAPVTAKFIRFTTMSTNSGAEPCLDELEIYSTATNDRSSRNVALATAGAKLTSSGDYGGNPFHRLEHLNDGKYGNSFSWIANTANTGWVQVELAEPTEIDRLVWQRDRTGQYLDRTPTNYIVEAALEPDKWQAIASSADRLPPEAGASGGTSFNLLGLSIADAARAKEILAQRRQYEERLAVLLAKPLAYAGRFEQPRATHRLFRGDPMQPREVIAPDCLTVLGTLGLSTETAEQQRRVALAKWIADANNPLTARVMVNRVWQHHFGTGLVDTPSDFGANGARPSHPELLDYLAQQFIARGWSLKALHRLMLTSQTYQQDSRPHAEGLSLDAQCRLLWRYPPHRLEAETIRDAILMASGDLDIRMGGPGWSTFKPNGNYVRFYDPKEEFGPAEYRRAIYMTKVRMRQDGVFGTFDCPDAGQIAPKRARSTTALQALSLFNSQFVQQQSQHLAARVEREAGADHAAQVSQAFLLLYGRTPVAAESTAAQGLVKEHGLPALCRAMLNANEFLFIP